MSTQNPIPGSQAAGINENETLETIGETTDQQPVITPAASGVASGQTSVEGSDAPGAQPAPVDAAAAATAATEETKKEKSDVQKRIDTLTRRRYELEGRNEELEYDLARTKRRLDAIERGEAAAGGGAKSSAETTAALDPNKPNREGFATYEDWVEALSLYNANKAIAIRDREYFHQQQSTAQNAVVDRWNTSLGTARDKYEDFDAVVGTDLKIPQLAFNAIVESQVGPDVAYFLGQHPEEAKKLAGLSPLGVVRAIGRIEARFEAGAGSTPATSPSVAAGAPGASVTSPAQSARPQATQRQKPVTSAASVPVIPIGSRATNSGKNPDDMSYQEFKKWREDTGRPSR